nr:MAG TPA: hypothetical protein [Caudoviricetes sp.]
MPYHRAKQKQRTPSGIHCLKINRCALRICLRASERLRNPFYAFRR